MSVYQCEICNFISMNKSDYNKHITTMKHLTRIQEMYDEVMSLQGYPDVSLSFNASSLLPKSLRNQYNMLEGTSKEHKLFLCKRCNKAYKSKNGLMHHSKKCVCGAIMDISNEIIPVDISFLEQHIYNHAYSEEYEPEVVIESEKRGIVGRIPQYAEEYSLTEDFGQGAFTPPHSDRRSPDKFGQMDVVSVTEWRITTHIQKDDVGVQMNMDKVLQQPSPEQTSLAEDFEGLCRSPEEYEHFHMGIILDLLPEAQTEMAEHILFAVSIGILSATLFLGIQCFYYL